MPATPDYDLRILRAIRRIIRAVDLHSKGLQAGQDITTPQLVCLMEVVNIGPCTSTALSKAVDLSPSTLVGILDRLQDKGLVTRTRSAEDRRAVRIEATDAGRALVVSAPSPLQNRLASSLAGLPELEQATLALALERVVELMGAGRLDASAILDIGPMQAGQQGGEPGQEETG